MNKNSLFLNAGSRGELEDPVGDVTFFKGDQTSTRPLAGSYDTGWKPLMTIFEMTEMVRGNIVISPTVI